MTIGDLEVARGLPVAIVAELSANHCGSLERAREIVEAAAAAGADAIKFQVYRPECLTFDSAHPAYVLNDGPWAGRRLWDLYTECQTPVEWLPELIQLAGDSGLAWFASPVSEWGLEQLGALDCPAYKIPSAEVCDTRFVELVAKAGKPVIISDGMASEGQMAEAMTAVGDAERLIVLKCVSEYPAPASGYNLATIPALHGAGVMAGVSDHTTDHVVPTVAAALGAVMIEKHIMSRDGWSIQAPDWRHSLDPDRFADMVEDVRAVEETLGVPKLGASGDAGAGFRRRLVAARDLPSGHVLEDGDVVSVRCAEGEPVGVRWEGGLTLGACRAGEAVDFMTEDGAMAVVS